MTDSRRHADRPPRGWIATIAATVAASGVLAGIAAAVVTVIVARVVVTPPKNRREAITIVGVDPSAGTVTLRASADSLVPGRYGLWFSLDSGHARIGEILSRGHQTVTRRLIGVDFGDITTASRGRFSGWFYLTPRDLGVPFENASIETTLGIAPAWLVPAETPSTTWVIFVHGRGVRRSEALRAVPVFRAAGFMSLLVSWRNDGDAPPSADKRYALGDTEWLDVEAGIRFAIESGATDVVLMGWSMGGQTVLQTATRSTLRDIVRGVALESPVVDWAPTLDFQASEMRVPRPLRRAALWLLGSTRAHRLTGQHAPIRFSMLDFVRRASEIAVPVLLLHSEDDGYVPSSASHALAAARPDIVVFRPWRIARHAKLWNYDPDRFDREVTAWLAGIRMSGG